MKIVSAHLTSVSTTSTTMSERWPSARFSKRHRITRLPKYANVRKVNANKSTANVSKQIVLAHLLANASIARMVKMIVTTTITTISNSSLTIMTGSRMMIQTQSKFKSRKSLTLMSSRYLFCRHQIIIKCQEQTIMVVLQQ